MIHWLVIVGVLLLLWQFWNSNFVRDYRRSVKMVKNVPGFKPLPLIGNAHQLIGDSQHLYKLIVEFSKICNANDGVSKFWLGPKLILIFTNPEYIKAITNTYLEKVYFYQFFRPWLGNGLLTAPAAIWKRSIKKLGAAFTLNAVEEFQNVFNEQAEKLVTRLKEKSGKEPFDIIHYVGETTLESVCQTSLGAPDISDNFVTKEYFEALTNVSHCITYRVQRIHLHLDAVFNMTSTCNTLMKSAKVLRDLNDTVLAKRKLLFNEKGAQKPNKDRSRFKPFINLLLEASQLDSSITDEQISDEVSTAILGGQETSAITLQFLFLTLGYKKDVQDRLYKEMKDIFRNDMRPITKEDLDQMPYCESVIHETLRLYPPGPVFIREADSDLELENITIPKGASCAINAWGVARSTKIWGEDAEEFNPDRWLNGLTIPPPGSYLPFSYGRRSCIGKKYALAFMKTIVAYCVRELIFESEAYNLTFKVDIMLSPVSGNLIKVMQRN